MLRFGVGLVAVMLSAIGVAVAQAPDPSPTTPVDTLELPNFEPTREEATLEAFVDGVVAAHMREHGMPGVTLSVVQNGDLVFAKGYGDADVDGGTPVSGQDTLFRIGSVSKTFIWASAMILVERGHLDLDTDVNQYLKEMQIPDAFGAPVTMNHLMAHRAGFEETFGVFMHHDDTDKSLADALVADMPKRVHAPGARTSYSNWGAALAAKIVEDISGKSYEAFLQEEILTPLAMTKTTLKGPKIAPASLKEKFSKGYSVKSGVSKKVPAMEIGPFASAGAMGATADDMARWMLVLLGRGEHDGVRLWSAETADAMWSRAFHDRPASGDIAHGFFTRDLNGHTSYAHGGGTAAFLTYMEVIPSLDAGVFISQNTSDNAELIRTISDLIIARLAAPSAPHSGMDQNGLPADEAADYVGTYMTNRRGRSKFERLFAIADTMRVSRHDDGALIVGASTGPRAVWPVTGEKDIFQDRNGARLSFGRDNSGAVTHASGMYQSYDRIGGMENPALLFAAIGGGVFFAATMLLGAWRRQGRNVSQTFMGRGLGFFQLVAAIGVIAFVGSLIAMLLTLAEFGAGDLLSYPPSSIVMFRLVAMGLFVVAALGVVSVAPAWTRSGWSIWRKSHHTLFTAALAILAVMMVNWNIIFAPLSAP